MTTIQGVIVKGKGEARTLGYPTANINYEFAENLEAGIWTCFVVHNEQKYQAVAVIGMWKLGNGLPSVEIHILDFNEDIYGSIITVTIDKKLRDLQKFTGVENLIEQIKQDIIEARKEFNHAVT